MKTLSFPLLILTISASAIFTTEKNLISQGQAGDSKREPIVLSRGSGSVISKCAVAAGEVYWLEEDKTILLHMKTEGGSYPSPLIRTNTSIEGFTVDNTGVYYVSQNKSETIEDVTEFTMQGELRKIDRKAGTVVSLVPDIAVGTSTVVLTDPSSVYFVALVEGKGTVIVSVPKAGGEATHLVLKTPGAINQSTVDDKNIYWIDKAYKRVDKMDKRGGVRTTVFGNAEGSPEPEALTGDEKFLYLATRMNGLFQISKNDGKATQIHAGSGLQFFGNTMVADENFVYWNDGNQLLRMKKPDGKPTPLRLTTSAITCVTTDEKYVYWFEMGKGLMKLEK